MKIKTLLILTLAIAFSASVAHAMPEHWDGFSSMRPSHHSTRIAPVKKLQRAFFAYSNHCASEAKKLGKRMTWAQQGLDENRNGTLEAHEMIPNTGHCEIVSMGQGTTKSRDKFCGGKNLVTIPVGIDEDLDGDVDADEMRAWIYVCEEPPTALEIYESESGHPGRKQ